MQTLDQARDLAHRLVEIGTECGLKVRAAISDMDQPLGTAVGNALEVKEAIRVLKGADFTGSRSGRFRELCLFYAGLALEAGDKGDRSTAESALSEGRALAKAKEWFGAQGGDLRVFESEDWGLSNSVSQITAAESGFVSRIDARAIGQAVIELGGGRKEKDDKIDPTVGIVLHVQVGGKVEKGQAVASVYSNTQCGPELERSVYSAFTLVDHVVVPKAVIIESV